MPIRKTPLISGEYYHVFNRGVDKRVIFTSQEELLFFFKRLHDLNSSDTSIAIKNARRKTLYNNERAGLAQNENNKKDELVSIVAYCLLPNHFHLLLRQKTDDGIAKFMQRIGSSYVQFFNKTHQRTGALFQGRFKAKHLGGEYGLPTLASYVNLNYKHHKIDPQVSLVKSSIFEYLKQEDGVYICDTQEVTNVLAELGGEAQYKAYAKDASIVFAKNKGIILTEGDFEF